MEVSIEKSENGSPHIEPSINTIEQSPKPLDLSKDRMDSVNSDIFEEAIEPPPVQDKENGNNGKHESEVTQEVFDENTEGTNNGDLDEFESFDDIINHLKVRDEYLEGIKDNDTDEIFEELETPVVNRDEKEQEAETINGETEIFLNGKDSLNGEDELNEDDCLNGEDVLNGEDGVNGEDGLNGEDVLSGEVQFYEEIPPEKIIEESDLVIKQEAAAETFDSFTGEDGVNGEDGVTGKVQSEEEIPPEKIIEESRDSDPVIIIEEVSDETQTGDLPSHGDDVDPIITEATDTPTGDVHFESELNPNDEVATQENKETPSVPVFEMNRDVINNGENIPSEETPDIEEIFDSSDDDEKTETGSIQNSQINKTENSYSSETPIVEIYDSSSSSDSDEKLQTPNPVPPPSVPVPPPSVSVPAPSVPVPAPAVPVPAPAGLGSAGSLPNPSMTRSASYNGRTSVSVQAQAQRQVVASDETVVAEPEEHDEIREKLMNIRVKFLRLVHRLGQTPHNTVVAQVLYRLGLAEQLRRNSTRPVVVSFDRASVLAEQLELSGSDPLDFSCTVLLLGKAGVGKSSTINSLFNDSRVPIHTFGPGTRSVNLISGNIHGINIKIIDTPGLSPSISDAQKNTKILHSIKKFVKNSPPDIVLYIDRLDVQSRDYGDVALLQTITNVFGASIWFNAIIVLTHAASAPPEGANGTALSYDMFVTQRTHVVQQNIRQAAGDVRLMNPVSLVENHLACRMNRAGKRVLPNGTVWEPQLLLLSFASKILGEANALLKLEDNNNGYNSGRVNKRVPPLPYFLSSLLQSRSLVKLPEEEQFGDLDDDLEDELEDFDEDLEDDYDDLPPFKRLSREQLERLKKDQKKAYLDELEYREKLFFRKQLKEERRRRKMLKKMKQEQQMNNNNEDTIKSEKVEGDETEDGPGTLPVPLPDMTLPASFDSDTPVHRYRFLDTNSQWLIRPVLDLHGWDHDIGYEGLNLERLFVIKDKVPVSISGQLAKDKKESSLQLDMSSSLRHGEGKASSLGLDLQAVGKDMSYTLRGETRFRSFARNATSAGGSVTFLGDSVSAGFKVEDKLVVNKQVKVLVTGGAMTGRGDLARGARVEATFKDRDYPIGRFLSTLALSVVDWHGDLAVGLNCQSQVPAGRGTNVVLNGNLNNKGSGQVGVRVNSSEQMQIALVALVPLVGYFKRVLFGSGFE